MWHENQSSAVVVVVAIMVLVVAHLLTKATKCGEGHHSECNAKCILAQRTQFACSTWFIIVVVVVFVMVVAVATYNLVVFVETGL